MARIVQLATFWVFQILNTFTGIALLFTPRTFHENMFDNHEQAYAILGFSPVALEMLHTVLRGQGAALLAISVYLFLPTTDRRGGYLLIACACLLTAMVHVFTAVHHLNSAAVQEAISSFSSLYAMIILDIVLFLGAVASYAMPTRRAL